MTSKDASSSPSGKRPGGLLRLRRRLERILWSLHTGSQKQTIYYEDRFGLYSYAHWIRTVERKGIRGWVEQCRLIESSPIEVCFVTAGEVRSLADLLTTLESLRAQAVHSWNLVFLLSKTSSLLHDQNLQSLLDSDARVRWMASDQPADSDAWRVLLDQLPGDWIVPFRPGDRFSSHWMEIFRLFLQGANHAEIVYWDEDMLDERGERSHPFFKPDCSPEYLFATDFLASAAFLKQFLLFEFEAKKELRSAWLFSALRSANKVVHIPAVLQSRTVDSAGTRQARAERHARRAQKYLQRSGYAHASASVSVDGVMRVSWEPEYPLVSIVIPTKNNLVYLQRCLSSLLEKTDYPQYEILLMDDHSTDLAVLAYYQEILAAHENIRLHGNEGTFNYSRVNNRGAALAHGSLVLFLNNDVEILSPGWLKEMVRWVLLPGVGMVGAKLLYPDGTIQHAGIVLGMTGHANHLFAGKPAPRSGLFASVEAYRNVSAVTGACTLVRRDIFEAVGGFDEDLGLVFNDVDLGLRFTGQGCRIVYTPAAVLTHYEGRSRARYIPVEDICLAGKRFMNVVAQGDPFYNPNLSYAVNWPTLRRADEPRPEKRLADIIRLVGGEDVRA